MTTLNIKSAPSVTVADATSDWNGVAMIRISCDLGQMDLTPEGHRPAAPSPDAWLSGALLEMEDVREAVPALYDAARERITRAAEHLDAHGASHYVYEESPGNSYRVSAGAVGALADYLDHSDEDIRRDAYSHWCVGAGADAEEI